ncbi:MAG: peptidase PmbA [Candidatus Methanofastidiosum methylothiophilum]|jgi:PmbA protein|uniref:Peptidase PmbA n=1 Tax=Candidatus Methanofastidiosum methylothiophilum TaxID=1705564 RepID=A0A150JM40_9EURY|nr:MAG: peptidase PmbA [Candidatus Methanofastidiosum methylthiophilus]MBP6932321.1 TldD/PmbA family protein [Methanofastidiosum sp.]OQC52671.1 MAG: peptidase PmbA [Euryarchaeota archaeon ADurb.Bin023]KYC56468.1 MAG: peptidase PmbA [Candidatus Methanofastidiosum methylthiophilus]KYC58315.1 MAG: peptidase PmbA [Candidatus Methanofastidiosum methylthiophilus]
MDLEEIAHKTMKFMHSEGDVFAQKIKVISYDIEKSNIEIGEEKETIGIGIRVIEGKKQGFSFTNNLTNLEDCVKTAYKVLKVSRDKEDFISLPIPTTIKERKLVDKSLYDITSKDLMEFSMDMIRGCKEKSGVPSSGSTNLTFYEEAISSTTGISLYQKYATLFGYLSSIYKNDDVATGFDYNIMRKKFEFTPIGELAALKAKETSNAKKIHPMYCDVILGPEAISSLLSNTFIPHLFAESVDKNKSFLKGKIGKKITNLTIIDDGTLEYGVASTNFDGDGNSTKRNIVIDNGILIKYLYDDFYAKKYGVESTGNSERDYKSLPSIGTTNFIIGGETLEGIEEGFIINELRGAHTANSISGDFSVEISSGFYINDGERKHPIKHGMIVGNIFEFLNKVKGVYGQVKDTGGIITPSIISEARVVG